MSTLANDTLKTYFLQEMEYLRRESVRFAGDYPQIAQELALNRERSDDPQVELLLQSFAYLSGQLRYQMAVDDAELSNQLLAVLNPQLEMPWPPRTVMQLEVEPDGASFDKANTLPAHSIFSAELDWNDETVPCRFRTTRALEVWPLRTLDARVQSHGDFDLAEAASGIRVPVRVSGHYSLQSMPIRRLQFHLDGPDRFRMHDLLYKHLLGVALIDPQRRERRQLLPADRCHFRDHLELESILPGTGAVHPGLVNLREYFAFPEHFLFFDLELPELAGFDREMDLVFLLKHPCPRVDPGCFKLNCVPLVNLFRQALEPFSLRAEKLEYLQSADQFRHGVTEILAIDKIHLQGADGRSREVPPLYGSSAGAGSGAGFWVGRRTLSQVAAVPGTEYHLRFADDRLQAAGLSNARVTGRAWCCNRRLAEKLRPHSRLHMEGAGPVQSGLLLRKPSLHRTPQLCGDRSQQLVMQLSSHFQPFENGGAGLQQLRDLLRQQIGDNSAEALAQVEAVTAVQSRRVTRRLGKDLWRGYCHGTLWQISVNRDRFGTSSSPLVFARALNQSLQHRVPINSFLEVELLDEQNGASIHRWQPQPGAPCPQ